MPLAPQEIWMQAEGFLKAAFEALQYKNVTEQFQHAYVHFEDAGVTT